jgi:hypothetical protein
MELTPDWCGSTKEWAQDITFIDDPQGLAVLWHSCRCSVMLSSHRGDAGGRRPTRGWRERRVLVQGIVALGESSSHSGPQREGEPRGVVCAGFRDRLRERGFGRGNGGGCVAPPCAFLSCDSGPPNGKAPSGCITKAAGKRTKCAVSASETSDGQASVHSFQCQQARQDGGNERSVEGDRAEAGTRQRTRIRTGDFLAVATNGSHSRNAAPGRFAEPRSGASAGGKQNGAPQRAHETGPAGDG